MRHDFIDRYSHLESPIHRRSTGAKAAATLAMILAAVAIPHTHLLLAIPGSVLLAILIFVSRVPVRFVLVRILLFEPLAVVASLAALVQPDGPRVAAAMVLRSTLCLGILVLFANTTPFAELLRLLRRLRVPVLLISILALTYRYVFVLLDERERLNRARRSRSFDRGRWKQWEDIAGLVGRLFVRSTERAERIYAAMAARGWQ